MNASVFQVGPLRIAVAAALAEGVAGDLLRGFAPAASGPAELRIAAALPDAARASPDEVPSFFHGSLRAFLREGSFLLHDGPTAVIVSENGRLLQVASPAHGDARCSERAVLVGLVLALRHHGLFHLHAAALEEPGGRRVLVAGTAGAGKTTLALALAAAGFVPLADDAVFVCGRGHAPSIVGIPLPFHLGPRTAAAFPAFASHLGAPSPTGKRPLPMDVLGARPEGGAMRCPDVVLLPEVASAAITMTEPTSPAAALGALLECGALKVADEMPGVAEQLTVLRAVIDRATVARVQLGADLLESPASVVRGLLDAAAPVSC